MYSVSKEFLQAVSYKFVFVTLHLLCLTPLPSRLLPVLTQLLASFTSLV